MREPFVVLEIEQQKCGLVYGESPCNASGPTKCYNTNKSCTDQLNYDPSDKIIWRFIKDNAQDGSYLLDASDSENVKTYGIPCLTGTSTNPVKVNIGGVQRDSGVLGTRATLSASFKDIPYNDQFADDYLITRTYNPLNQGTFWGKWLARNPYYKNSIVRIYEGEYGQQLSDMRKREYVLQKIDRDGNGNVSLQAKDALILAGLDNSEIPKTSDLTLDQDLTEVNPGKIDFVGNPDDLRDIGLGSAGERYLIIDDEIIKYGAITDTTVFGTQRGQFGTEIKPHDKGAKAQRLIRYLDADVADVLRDVFKNYTKLESVIGNVDDWYQQWKDEAEAYQFGFKLSGTIVEPQPVLEFLPKILQNSYMYWDERKAAIEYRVNRPPDRGSIKLLTDEKNILSNSIGLNEKPQDRRSRLIYYYNYDYDLKMTSERDKLENFRNVFINVGLDSESKNKYDEIRPLYIYSDFVTQQRFAEQNARLLLNKYIDTPRFISLKLDSKDADLWISDVVDIETTTNQNLDGSPNVERWQIISAQESISNDTMTYELQSYQFSGRYGYWTTADYPNYLDATQQQRDRGSFWSDQNGLMSNGDPGYRWQP